MNVRTRLAATAVPAALLVFSTWGQVPSCSKCQPDPPPGAHDIVFDARDGSTTWDGKSFGLRQKLRVILRNRNPFLYSYTVKVDAKEIQEPGLTSFLGLLSPFIADQLPTPKPQTEAQAKIEQPSCSPRLQKIQAANIELEKIQKRVSDTFTDLQAGYKLVGDAIQINRTILQDGSAACPELCTAANVMLTTLKAYTRPDLDTMLAEVEVFSVKSADQQGRITQFREDFPECTDKLDNLPDRADDFTRAAAISKANKLKLAQAIKDADSLQNEIVTVGAFYSVQDVGPFLLPTNLTVTITRTKLSDKAAKPETLTTLAVNVGGQQRFVLAGGLAFPPLEKREYQRIQGLVKDSSGNVVRGTDGQPTVASVVGFKQDSHWRISPMVFLHARLFDIPHFVDGFYISAGVTAKNDNKGTDIEYLVGPSFSFVQGRLFLTLGAYGGQVQRLDDGYYLGAPTPKDLAEIPVRKSLRWSPGFALSWKIK